MSYKGRGVGISIAIMLTIISYISTHYIQSVWLYSFLSGFTLLLSYFLGKKFDELIMQTNQDRLTHLFNRKFVEESFQKISSLATRNNSRLFVLMIDCDNFKQINDSYGHSQGDRVLIAIANLLDQQFRKSDIAARWGGDEFIVIGQLNTNNGIASIIERVHQDVEQLSNSLGVKLSISIGYAVYPDDHLELVDLLHIADLNMYKQKAI